MDKLYSFIWKYKRHILCLSLLFISACVIKLKDFKIYFESERIIKELTTESFTNRDAKNLNNENIFLATIRNNNKYEYEDFLHLKDQINEIKKLKEIKRVMKIDAKMLFCEHGTAPDKNIIKWQNRINPIWGKLFGGCNINRDIPNILKENGFKINRLDQMYLPSTPKIVGYNYWGEATN